MEKWSPRICLAWESIWYSSFGIQVIIRSFSNRSHPRAPQQQRIPFVHLKNIREGFSKHSSWPQPLMTRIENTFKMKWPIFLLYLPFIIFSFEKWKNGHRFFFPIWLVIISIEVDINTTLDLIGFLQQKNHGCIFLVFSHRVVHIILFFHALVGWYC